MNLNQLKNLRILLQNYPQFHMPLCEHSYLLRTTKVKETPSTFIFFEDSVVLAVFPVNHPLKIERTA